MLQQPHGHLHCWDWLLSAFLLVFFCWEWEPWQISMTQSCSTAIFFDSEHTVYYIKGFCTNSNRSRKKIAKYKAATSLLQKNEDQELLKENSTHPASDMPLQGNKPHMSNSDTSEQSNAGNIVVTWKDGNTSCLYPDPAVEEKQEEEKKETVTAAELDSADEVKIMS